MHFNFVAICFVSCDWSNLKFMLQVMIAPHLCVNWIHEKCLIQLRKLIQSLYIIWITFNHFSLLIELNIFCTTKIEMTKESA